MYPWAQTGRLLAAKESAEWTPKQSESNARWTTGAEEPPISWVLSLLLQSAAGDRQVSNGASKRVKLG